MFSLENLKNDLETLGVKKGDTLLIRADLGSIGKLEIKKREDYINFMLESVGEEGTIVGLSFTSVIFYSIVIYIDLGLYSFLIFLIIHEYILYLIYLYLIFLSVKKMDKDINFQSKGL